MAITLAVAEFPDTEPVSRLETDPGAADIIDAAETVIAELRARLAIKEAADIQRHEKINAIRELRYQEEDCKSKLKIVRGQLELAVDKLLADCDEQPTLFDGVNGQKLVEVNPADDLWRTDPIGELGLPKSIVDKLVDADITTMGQLADFSKDGVPLTQIKGVGQASADKIEAATESYWQKQKTEQDKAGPGLAEGEIALVGRSVR